MEVWEHRCSMVRSSCLFRGMSLAKILRRKWTSWKVHPCWHVGAFIFLSVPLWYPIYCASFNSRWGLVLDPAHQSWVPLWDGVDVSTRWWSGWLHHWGRQWQTDDRSGVGWCSWISKRSLPLATGGVKDCLLPCLWGKEHLPVAFLSGLRLK